MLKRQFVILHRYRSKSQILKTPTILNSPRKWIFQKLARWIYFNPFFRPCQTNLRTNFGWFRGWSCCISITFYQVCVNKDNGRPVNTNECLHICCKKRCRCHKQSWTPQSTEDTYLMEDLFTQMSVYTFWFTRSKIRLKLGCT